MYQLSKHFCTFANSTNTNTMQDELTSEMHSEFEVDEETDIIHRCISLWCLWKAKDTDPDFARHCTNFGLTVEQAMKYKEYCLGLK